MKKRRRLTKLLITTLLFGAFLVVALCASWAVARSSASASNGLACSVKPSCSTGEVAVFRTSSTSNAHAGTPGGSSYGNVVCCGGVDGLGTSCSGVYDTVLSLSGADNAHVAYDAGYSTEVCLSAGAMQAVQCSYEPSCHYLYACLSTISGTTNAHVADCDGSDDYATKVCCYAGDPIPVGGVAELPNVSGPSNNYAPLAAALMAGTLVLTAGAWYARRRWGR